jgi:hypothetical protein
MMAEKIGIENFFLSIVKTQGKNVSVEDKRLTVPMAVRGESPL